MCSTLKILVAGVWNSVIKSQERPLQGNAFCRSVKPLNQGHRWKTCRASKKTHWQATSRTAGAGRCRREFYSEAVLRLGRAAIERSAGRMRPASRVFETFVLGQSLKRNIHKGKTIRSLPNSILQQLLQQNALLWRAHSWLSLSHFSALSCCLWNADISITSQRYGSEFMLCSRKEPTKVSLCHLEALNVRRNNLFYILISVLRGPNKK